MKVELVVLCYRLVRSYVHLQSTNWILMMEVVVFFLFSFFYLRIGRPTSLENANKFREGTGDERKGKIKRSFTGMSEKKREDSGEGAWHCVCMIGCDGSEAFTRIYECLF